VSAGGRERSAPPRGWGRGVRLLHWTMAALILFQLGLGLYVAHGLEDLGRRFELTQLHKSWGATIFALALARLAWRLAQPGRPPPPASMPRWQARAAAASHAALYALMLAAPISGWVYASASPLQDLLGIENEVFGVFALPDPWVPGDEALAAAARRAHGAAAWLLLALVAVHAAAALKHHFVDRDDVLTRMVRGGDQPRPR
jgi:cytochrome b561